MSDSVVRTSPPTEEQQLAIEAKRVRLRANGDLYFRADGHDTVVAHFDQATGHLEFLTKEYSVKMYQPCIDRLGSTDDGKSASDIEVKTIGIKGVARAKPKNVPEFPEFGPEGDAAKEVVQWFLDYNMPEAIIRYRILTDENGNPVRRNVKRLIINTIDERATVEDKDLEWRKIGGGQERGAIMREGEWIYADNAIIARRQTPLTFLPEEVIGGYKARSNDYKPSATAQIKEDEE